MKSKKLMRVILALSVLLVTFSQNFLFVKAEEEPCVSVIVPVYNSSKYLRRCMDSIVEQTLQNIEVICVNDGSTDDSLEILREYESKDNRVKVITQENQGCWAARNTGMDVASGKYLSFIDSDDYIELNLYEKAYEAAYTNNADILYFGANWGNKPINYENLAVDVKTNTEYRPFMKCFTVWNKLYKNSMIKESGVKFENIVIQEDLCFDLMVLPWAKKLVSIEGIYYHYDKNNTESVSHTSGYDKISFKMVPLVCKAWREKDYLKGNELELLSFFLGDIGRLVMPISESANEVYRKFSKEILNSFGPDIYNLNNVLRLKGPNRRILQKLEKLARQG